MSDERIARARSITSAGEAAAVYRDWAASYDDDVFGRLGFTGSARIAELLVAHLPDRSAPVLDLGCGTGAVGVRLAELGVTTIDGVDLSPEMLAIAEQTGAYRTLSVADLTAGDLDAARAATARPSPRARSRAATSVRMLCPVCCARSNRLA